MTLLMAVMAVLGAGRSEEFTWSVSSAKGTAVLTQTALPDDACALRCEVKGKVSWTEQSCLSRVTDFTFPADDCSRVLTLLEYPVRAATIEKTVAAAALTATGAPGVVKTKVYVLGELVDVSRLRGGEGKRVRWLAGVAGEPGSKPRFNSDGSGIEFGTTEGATRAVRFGEELGAARVSAAPSAPAATRAAETGLYQYTGADGSTHVVMGLAQVPSAYRKSATLVESEIDTVASMKKPAPPAPPPRRDTDPAWMKAFARPPPTSAPPVPPTPPVQRAPPARPQGGGQIFGLSGPAGDAVLLQEQLRRGGNNLPNSTQPPALPPKPPSSPYVPPPSPYTPPPSPYAPPPSPYAPAPTPSN